MSDFLQTMRYASELRAQEIPDAMLVTGSDVSAPLRTSGFGFDVIAEIKRRSPSAGMLSETADIAGQARSYAAGGAAAVSVLTEPERFGGSLDDLSEVAAILADERIPVLRKDFLVTPGQVRESRAAGAGGILLILKILDEGELQAMLDTAADCNLFVLLEAFDRDDLKRMRNVLQHPAEIFYGLNCRNLKTLEVDRNRFGDLAAEFPGDTRRVAESGIENAADAAVCAALGYSMALVGSALMRSDDPEKLLTDMLKAGRAAARAA